MNKTKEDTIFMQVLEKILEEIEEAIFQEDAPIYLGDMVVDGYVKESVVKEIIRSHMDEIENAAEIAENTEEDKLNE